MIKKDIIISESTPIKEAMRLIYKNDFSMVIIEREDGQFLSLLTSGDIRKSIIGGIDILEPVRSIIKGDVLTIRERDIDKEEIVTNLVEEANRREAVYIPVLGDNNKVKYIIPTSNLLNCKHGGLEKQNIIKKVLIVGGAGYLGSILVRKLLEKNYYVKVLDNLSFDQDPLPEHKNIEFLKGDMRDIITLSDAIKGVDSVILLAGVVGDPASKSFPRDTLETNLLATKVLAEACKYNQINRFIFASSCSVYGTGGKFLDEDSELNPLSFYARSKVLAEKEILKLADENFSPCFLRMSTLYGFSPRMRFDLVLNLFVAHALKNKKITVFGGEQYRPLLHVEDAAEAYIKCLEAPLYKIKGQVFNVGSEEQNYKIADLAKEIKTIFPEIEIEVLHEDVDRRNYRISFDKINAILDFKVQKTVKDAALEIKEAFDKGLIEDYENKKYRNN